jgi:DNA-binding SARP family transcriptional activator
VAAATRHTLGVCEARLGNVETAMANYEAAAALWEQLGNRAQQARLLNMIGLAHESRGAAAAAERAVQRALDLAEGAGHVSTQAIVLVNLAQRHRYGGELVRAKDAIDRALALARQIDEHRILGEALCEASLIALCGDDPAEAVQLLQSAQDTLRAGWQAGACLVPSLLALAYARFDRRAEAVAALDGAVPLIGEVRAADIRLRCEIAQAAAMAALGQAERALKTLNSARRFARRATALAVFFRECAQHQETAALVVNQRNTSIPDEILEQLRAAARRARGAGRPAAAKRLIVLPKAAADEEIEIRMFGPPLLLRGDTVVRRWRMMLARDLFFYLVLRADSVVRTDAIVEDLLPDGDPDQSITALRQAVYQVRRTLAPHELVQTVRGGYRFLVQPLVVCDYLEFDRLTSRVRALRGEAALEALEMAVRRYQGPLLDGIDAQWVEAPRADMERRFLMAAQTLVREYERVDRPDEAVALAQKVVAMDPFQEDFHVALLRNQMAMGHIAAARSHFRHYQQVMQDELGQAPAPEAYRIVGLTAEPVAP